jgi:hypothetical protein
LVGQLSPQKVHAIHSQEFRVDERRIGQKPFVVVDLVELSELHPKLADGGLKVGQQWGEGLQLMKEEEGLLDAGGFLPKCQEEGELRRKLKRFPGNGDIEAREVEPLLMPIANLVEVDP